MKSRFKTPRQKLNSEKKIQGNKKTPSHQIHNPKRFLYTKNEIERKEQNKVTRKKIQPAFEERKTNQVNSLFYQPRKRTKKKRKSIRYQSNAPQLTSEILMGTHPSLPKNRKKSTTPVTPKKPHTNMFFGSLVSEPMDSP